MLGSAQYAIGDGHKGDMLIYRLKVPYLILIEPIRFSLFVVDFNGPAMASYTGDAHGLPMEPIADEQHRSIGQVLASVVDDKALLPKVGDTMRVTRAVIDLVLPFIGDRALTEDRRVSFFQGFFMFFTKLVITLSKRHLPLGKAHRIIACQRAHIREVKPLLSIPAEVWLCIPVVKGDR